MTAPRPQVDCTQAMRWWVDEGSPEATGMRVGLDHLHTPKITSRYEAFEPAEARRSARKLALHDTPKHGSWLNMAESALSVLQHQGLDRRIPDEATRTRAIAAWEAQRNAEQATLAWRFSVTEARKKLKRLYPSLPSCWRTRASLPHPRKDFS